MIDSHFQRVRDLDFRQCYVFDSKSGGQAGSLQLNIKKNSQEKVLKGRLPKLTMLESVNSALDPEGIIKQVRLTHTLIMVVLVEEAVC